MVVTVEISMYPFVEDFRDSIKEFIRKLELPRGAEICMVISAGKRDPNGIYGAQIRFAPSLFLFEV